MFHVGQKVVCVDDCADSYTQIGIPEMDGLRRNVVYTVRWAGCVDHTVLGQYPGVMLYEIERAPWGGKETPYHAGRFRPITERKTDISIFHKMLTDIPHELESTDATSCI